MRPTAGQCLFARTNGQRERPPLLGEYGCSSLSRDRAGRVRPRSSTRCPSRPPCHRDGLNLGSESRNEASQKPIELVFFVRSRVAPP